MPRSTVSRFPRAGLQRRQSTWSQGAGGILTSSASASLLFGTGAQAALAGLTIVRTRGFLNVSARTAAAALDGFSGAVGLAIVSENAFGIGITAVPTPITDIAWDGWLWHQLFSVKSMSSTVDSGGILANARFTIDSKAMRKIKLTDIIVMVAEVTEVGTSVFHAEADTRFLSKLS